MKGVASLLSSCFGVGFIRGGGTVAAMLTCAAWHFAGVGHDPYNWMPAIVTAIVLMVGVWSAGIVEGKWGKDSSRVVIDEVAGMCLSVLFIPVKWPYILIGLILFRFFDIVKPLYIRRLEGLQGGWGVMMDDMLAGVYSNLILQGLVFLKLW